MIENRGVLDGREKIEIARRDQGAGAKVRAEAGVGAETGGEGGLHQDPDEDMTVGVVRDGLGPGVPAPADQMMTSKLNILGVVH